MSVGQGCQVSAQLCQVATLRIAMYLLRVAKCPRLRVSDTGLEKGNRKLFDT